MWYTRVLRDGAKPEPPLEHVRVRPVHSFYYLPKFRWSRFLFGAVTATIFGYVSGVYGNEFIADMARREIAAEIKRDRQAARERAQAIKQVQPARDEDEE